MLPQQRVPAALHAIHRILVQARWMAYNEAPAKQMAAILDDAEILPTLLANDRDETVFFQLMLEGIAEHFPACRGILSEYVQQTGSVPTDQRDQSRTELLRMLTERGESMFAPDGVTDNGQERRTTNDTKTEAASGHGESRVGS